ncbi:hypothetical protein BpHYR1_041382 [Brachionus plicatilis]|uniref:Uncharacterized protein n=1 Tax=Brachionus plicatilis TaxID=10195 RepID=A0A3M7SM00_BRAPC|nr:hypothetical protein BpHYR1_041382 [Brachionus plicatilis]
MIIQPFVKKTNSQNLIQKLDSIKFSENSELYSCDFESLYTNIDHRDAQIIICDFMKDKIESKHLNIQELSFLMKSFPQLAQYWGSAIDAPTPKIALVAPFNRNRAIRINL